MIRQNQSDLAHDDEINLGQIIEFLAGEWRKLLFAATTAMVLVIGAAVVLGSYTVNGLIINSSPGNADTPRNSAFDFVKWKYFQKALPNFAAELIQTGRVKADDVEQFKRMSRPEWWNKNVAPVFAFSKDDSKLLGGVSKELEEVAATIIQYLVVESSGATKDAAEKNLAISIDFVRSGAEYLTLKGLVSNVGAATEMAEADIRKKLLTTEVEMNYLEQRSKNLEQLRKRFPSNNVGEAARGQILDLKDATAKYMPLETQLVAVNSDIYALSELLSRLKNDQVKQAVIREFLEKAAPATEKNINGASLGEDLLGMVTAMRKSLATDDLIRQEALTVLEANIRSIRTSFDKGLQSSAASQAHRVSGFVQRGLLGFFGGGFAMLIYLMLRRTLKQARSISHGGGANPPDSLP